MEQRPDPLKRLYGAALDHFWRQKGVTAASLAAAARCDSSYLYLIKSGKRLPNPSINKALDAAVEAGGLLVTLGEVIEEESRRTGRTRQAGEVEGSMERRLLLQHALAALAAGTAGTAAALETIRDGLARSVSTSPGAEHDVDEWAEVAWEYGRAYLTTAPDVLVADIAADVVDVQQRLQDEDDDVHRQELSRVSAQLAGLMAMSLTNLGQLRAARRWWRTARQAADASEDPLTRVWIRGEQAIRALYSHRSPQAAIDLADEALAISGTYYRGKALAGKAQALAAMGRADEAKTVIRMIEPALEQMPASVVDDQVTVYGWPEHCLRHAESYVYSHIGDSDEARRAQRQALALYPPTEQRARALVQLHQAMCLIADGHLDDGSLHAQHTIGALPTSQRTALVMQVGHRVLNTVPAGERDRSSVTGLYEMLALPSARSPHD
ncbi:hypothetical protein [Phytohabitans rumicis]|uniref:HTH cro/C1-type domain-containing protein n=1 Tax=Phytohabitans rumicis TaxID=1076125 RepID=A0A6V8KUP7_9ACTN|nr:hypothetical protein [Phytohabitans rumicis]GFJ87554.1 hypothetical protein Prum_011960 [Phytohabitans rumicis]